MPTQRVPGTSRAHVAHDARTGSTCASHGAIVPSAPERSIHGASRSDRSTSDTAWPESRVQPHRASRCCTTAMDSRRDDDGRRRQLAISYGRDILVVDDNQTNLVAIEAALLAARPQARARALRASKRSARLLEQDFALIILDVAMPGMDGFETARLVRSRARNRATPIIFVTGLSWQDDAMLRGYELGAFDFLMKPIRPEVLRAKASVFVELQERTLELQAQGRRAARGAGARARARAARAAPAVRGRGARAPDGAAGRDRSPQGRVPRDPRPRAAQPAAAAADRRRGARARSRRAGARARSAASSSARSTTSRGWSTICSTSRGSHAGKLELRREPCHARRDRRRSGRRRAAAAIDARKHTLEVIGGDAAARSSTAIRCGSCR